MVKGKPFKKDGKWLVVRECDGCGDVKEVSTGAAKTRRGRGLATYCWTCSQKQRKLPNGKHHGNWKHGITFNGYKRRTIDGKRVLEHIWAAEQKLGRKLTEQEEVHHVDLDKSNNAPDNLYVYRNASEHHLGHDSAECCGYQFLGSRIWYDRKLKQYVMHESVWSVASVEVDLATAYIKRDPRGGGRDYQYVWNKHDRRAERVHMHVAKQMLGRELTRREHVHHIDGDTTNNVASNLQVMTASEHKKCHWSLQRCVAALYNQGVVGFDSGVYGV